MTSTKWGGQQIYKMMLMSFVKWSLDVVERDGVGDVEAEEEDVGVVEGQRAHRVVGRRAWKREKERMR